VPPSGFSCVTLLEVRTRCNSLSKVPKLSLQFLQDHATSRCLDQINLVCTLTDYFLRVHFNIILPPTSMPSRCEEPSHKIANISLHHQVSTSLRSVPCVKRTTGYLVHITLRGRCRRIAVLSVVHILYTRKKNRTWGRIQRMTAGMYTVCESAELFGWITEQWGPEYQFLLNEQFSVSPYHRFIYCGCDETCLLNLCLYT
jgi:hypothetical protein